MNYIPVIRNLKTGEIVKTANPISAECWPIKIADTEATIWRYADFWKLESLFNEKKLYFRRADKQKDSKELLRTDSNNHLISPLWKESYSQLLNRDAPDPEILKIQESHRNRVFLSCWHKNKAANPRMWQEYTESKEAIAIRTRVSLLIRLLPKECTSSDVTYVTEEDPLPDMHSLFFAVHKRKVFEWESEFRIMYQLPPHESVYLDCECDFGRQIILNPAAFVEEIIIHPGADTCFKDNVCDIVEKSGCRRSIVRMC